MDKNIHKVYESFNIFKHEAHIRLEVNSLIFLFLK